MGRFVLCTRVMLFTLMLLCLTVVSAERRIDVVSPVAGKDAVVYRYCLRHVLKYVKRVRNVYVVCRVTPQMSSIVAQANEHFVRGDQRVILVDEKTFPFNFDNIREFLKRHRPTEGFNGQPFDATVVVPDVCEKVYNAKSRRWQPSPKQPKAEWIHKCRQPYENETQPGSGRNEGAKVVKSGDGKSEIRVQSFDRTGWMLQQFLKLGAGEAIPGILEAYVVVDADTVFYDSYSPIPEDDEMGLQYNYMPGDARDCGNPPYFMLTDALKIPQHGKTAMVCAGRSKEGRRCKNSLFCPIAHQMVYERSVLRALFEHIEGVVGTSKLTGKQLSWWEGVLLTMSAWHTSPFSEYVTYFQWAVHRYPSHVRIYDNKQIGATEDEIPANYFMSNGLGVTKACGLLEFSAATTNARQTMAMKYCTGSGKKGDTCLFYRPGDHSGAACPAPKYMAYHGFRNDIPDGIVKAYHQFDLQWLETHQLASFAKDKLPNMGSASSGGTVKAAALQLKLDEARANEDPAMERVIQQQMVALAAAVTAQAQKTQSQSALGGGRG